MLTPSRTVLLLLIMLLAACGDPYRKLAAGYHFEGVPGQPDYSLLENWAAHPNKHDPSDSVPEPLRDKYSPDIAVDVFFIHPTTYVGKAEPFGLNGSVTDAELAAKTDYSSILFQASVFNEAGRVFAPRYRQAHYKAYFPLTNADTVAAAAAFELAYEDVKAAFMYYMQHFNHGRPIIIASHSQGTNHGIRLLHELFDGKPLQQQLVAAYLVGMPLQAGYFKSIQPCTTPAQTGCACSWRTFKDGYRPEYIRHETVAAVVTNPLTWTSTQPNATRAQNPGSVLLKFNKVLPGVVNASVGDGVLWTNKPRFFGNVLLRSKNYHVADLNLFYVSIRNNAKLRAEAFSANAREGGKK